MTIKLFPTILIIIDLISADVYGIHGDVRHLIYWLAAAVLSVTVTF